MMSIFKTKKNSNKILNLKIQTILVLSSLIFAFSCNKIKNKSHEIASKSKQKVKQKSSELLDDVFPQFDSDIADSENNKSLFSEFIKIAISSDVKNIYCYNDEIGVDVKYQFAFHCNEETSKEIIDQHQLRLDTASTHFSTQIQTNFPWWDREKIVKLALFSHNNQDQYFEYYWYDTKEQKAYFLHLLYKSLVH